MIRFYYETQDLYPEHWNNLKCIRNRIWRANQNATGLKFVKFIWRTRPKQWKGPVWGYIRDKNVSLQSVPYWYPGFLGNIDQWTIFLDFSSFRGGACNSDWLPYKNFPYLRTSSFVRNFRYLRFSYFTQKSKKLPKIVLNVLLYATSR